MRPDPVVSLCWFTWAAAARSGESDGEGEGEGDADGEGGGGGGLIRNRAPDRLTRPGEAAATVRPDGAAAGAGDGDVGVGTTARGSRMAVLCDRSISWLCTTKTPAPPRAARPARATPNCLRRWLRRSRASDR